MKPLFSLSLKSGLVALALATGIPPAAQAGPLPQPAPSAPSNALTSDVIKVRDGWSGNRKWRHGGHRWNNSNRWGNRGHWRRGHHWDNDWRWRHRHHHRRYYGGSGFYLGLGLLPAYPLLYDDYYYRPRPVYRTGLSRAHVRWCYSRYRSYRAYDNTYQPYHGPRRQCRSPYY